MKTKSILTLLSIMTAFSLFAQEDKAFFELNNDSQIDIRATSTGSYKDIKVEVSNFGNETVNVHFPVGGLFVNLDSTEQNLVVLFYDKLVIGSGKTEEVLIGTACANPKRKVPKNALRKFGNK